MTTWMIYAVLAAVFAGLVPVFGKHGLSKVDPHAATAVRSAIMTGFLLALTASSGRLATARYLDRQALGAVALSGLAGALSWLFYFWALRDGPAAGVVGIDRTSVVFAVLFAGLFLAEPITKASMIGAVLVVIGALLMASS